MTGKRKILLVSSAFYPEISPRSLRATELAREFSRQGHEVTVISKFRDHDYSDFLKEVPIIFRMWRKQMFPYVPELKLKPFSFLSRGISRLLLLLFEYPGIEDMFKVKKMLRHEREYDLMISFAVPYPVHWGVAFSRSPGHRIAKIWVADCGDPYMGDVIDSFKKPFYFGFLEKNFCRKADFISVPISGAMDGYYKEFHDKIMVIPQGFDFDLGEVANDIWLNDVPTFAYAGGFIPGIRDPQQLMNYLTTLDIPFKFYVFTNNPGLFEEYRSILNEKLVISGYIPRHELMRILSRMDFLVNFDNNTSMNSPSKLIDYAITGRPVLNIKNKLYAEEILAFLKKDYSKRMILPNPAKYHIKNISRNFLDLLN